MTPLLILLGFIFGIILLVGIPSLGALILWILTRWFKFKKRNFKTASYTVLISFGVMIVINTFLTLMFIDKLVQLQYILVLIAILASFISGFFVIFKFYKESIGKTILVWLLTCIIGLIFFFILIIIIALIFGTFFMK